MDDITELKSDIDAKLEKEVHNLTVLRESLKKSTTNTENMLDILSSFENRLKRLESTIVPVYNETENLRRLQENIEKSLNTVDSVLGYYHIAVEVEAVIKEGPSACDLETYLGYMERLLHARNYFMDTNPTCDTLEDIQRVFYDGRDALQHEFRSLLSRHGRPVPPVVMMDLLGSEDEPSPVGLEADPLALEHLPEKVVGELSEISRWLVANGNATDFIKSYTTARAGMLARSLTGLKDHIKAASGTTTTLIVQSSPALGNKFRGTKDTPARKSMKKISSVFLKKATASHLKSPFEPGHRRQGSSTEAVKEEVVDIETDLYITELTALLRLIQSEAQLMATIIPEKHQRMALDVIVQQGLDLVCGEGEKLAVAARKNIGRHEFTAVLAIFPIVKHLRAIKPEFDLALEGCQAPTRSKVAKLLSTLDSMGAKALEEFIESIRHDPDKLSNMPKDGTVHQLTNHAIIFLEQLQEYKETAGAMLLVHGEQALPSPNIDRKTCEQKVADYMTQVLSGLGLNLTNKAETYQDPALRPIFIMNNYNYILKCLKRSGLMDLILAWNDSVESFYRDRIDTQRALYSESWSKVMHYLLEVDKPMSVQRLNPEAKLKDKERQNIKDRFTGFNKELEDLYRIQKGYAIPDPELRESLKRSNKEYVLPKYEIFLNKYKALNFSKNKDKYIKHTVEGVGELIDRFFDAAA